MTDPIEPDWSSVFQELGFSLGYVPTEAEYEAAINAEFIRTVKDDDPVWGPMKKRMRDGNE